MTGRLHIPRVRCAGRAPSRRRGSALLIVLTLIAAIGVFLSAAAMALQQLSGSLAIVSERQAARWEREGAGGL